MARRRQRVRFSLFAFQDIITGLCGVLILLVMLMLIELIMAPERNVAEPMSAEETDGSIETLRCEIARLEKELAKARELARNVIVSLRDAAAPEVAAKLITEMSDKERELAALVSQVADLQTRVAVARKIDARNKKKVLEMEETRRVLEGKLAALKDKRGITLIPERGSVKSPIYIICGRVGVEIIRPLKKNTQGKWVPRGQLRDGVTRELEERDHTTYTVVLLVRPSGVDMMEELSELVKGLGFSCGRDPLEEDVEVSFGTMGGGS